jgi:hypothetical protein
MDPQMAKQRIASLHRHGLLDRLGRSSAKSILAPVLKNQPNGCAEVGAALFNIPALAIGAGDFRRPGNKPIAVNSFRMRRV